MADFCSICIGELASGDLDSTDIGDIIMNYTLLQGGDIKIHELFDEYIKIDMDTFLENENYGLNVSGICEHCGLSRLSVLKEDDIIYLVAWCFKSNLPDTTGKYKIAIIKNGDLEPVESELKKLYED